MTSASITPTTKLQRGDGAVFVDMDGETVMMDIEKGSYFALTGSGSYIWAALETPVTLSDIVAQVQEKFDTSGFGGVEEAVTDFVEELFANGLVVKAA